ncbi:MAG TPA: F0F1 ATP synthase subunit B [Candidatus Sulfotelmatobacter sp.]|nr:F0F1 ATP synthase subunit B [Candidatus Sulfotelmatobacter sp.]
MTPLALAGSSLHAAALLAAADTGGAGLQINFFWVIVSTLNFVVFAILLYVAFGRTVSRMLADRRARIEQGLKDADLARRERDAAAQEKQSILQAARREANDIVAHAQKTADDVRQRDVAATQAELERLREQAAAEIAAEKARVLGEVRGQIADLALLAAARVVGETRTSERERRLVQEFLSTTTPGGPAEPA